MTLPAIKRHSSYRVLRTAFPTAEGLPLVVGSSSREEETLGRLGDSG
jgi:hypothetical protein